MAKKKKKAAQQSAPRIGKGKLFLYFLVLVALAFVLRYAVLLLVLGLLPAFVARYVDSSADGNQSRVILACNFSGVLPFIADLYKQGITADNVHSTLFDPTAWLTMYGAAAFGWGLVWFFPKAVHFVMGLVQHNSIKGLSSKQQQIIDEWGMEVERASRRVLRNAAFREEQKQRKEATQA